MKYETVIGLEIHVETNTKQKMFCTCSTDYFGKQPNSVTCPVCLGLPGSLPVANKAALIKCVQIGLALNCEINKESVFERKNYFYPDLPKGYQISQLRWPLCTNGWIEVEDDPSMNSGPKKIRINRVHQEEDTGKLTHLGNETLIDFNRSGVPLVEIVTEPDFTSSYQVRDYAKKLQQIFRYLGVSNADMEKGDMRLEANISVRPEGTKGLPNYRVELKNINSFRFIVAAIEYEIKRQIEALEKGEKLIQETRGWDQDKKQTYTQRVKEEANDYRYFPDPDLPGVIIEKSRVESLESSLPELPAKKVKRFMEQYQITKADAVVLTDTQELADFYKSVAELAGKEGISGKQLANYLINQKVGVVDPWQVIQAIQSKSAGVISDESELEKMAQEVINESLELVKLYQSGKTTVIMALVGLVMKKSQGKANAQKVRVILEQLLKP